MTQLLTRNSSPYALFREKFRYNFFQKGIKPVDARQPIPDELALEMIQELDVTKDALIGVFDAFLILTTHLREQGYTNIVLLESLHNNLTSKQEEYYNTIKQVCEQSGIKYYVPPMNNYGRCDMKFDVIIGNPPYQDLKEGSRSGSSSEPLWWQITKKSFSILKDDGILSFVTPTTLFTGGEQFTSFLLGKSAKYNLQKVDFSANNHFNVGIDICRWVAKNSKPNFNVEVNDGRVIDASRVDYISTDKEFDSIIETLINSNQSKLTFNQSKSYDYRTVAKELERLNFNQSNRYDYQAVAKDLKKDNCPEEWAKDLTDAPDDEHIYPVANNDKIKYSRVKWKDYGVWRVFVPQFTGNKDLKFWIDDKMAATGSTWTHRCSCKEEAERILSIVNTPEYKWIINKLKVNGRITGKIRSLPAAPLEEVLTLEQISYIQSQL